MLKAFAGRTRPRARSYQGSAMLDSYIQRFLRVLIVVVLMWALAGWAMDWW